MKPITCNTCNETVYLYEADTVKTDKETPLDHMERTGHDPRQPAND